MGWYGNWSIKYKGQDNEKFVNLAKMIIPNYVKRFEETEKGTLECLRNLSWYNADVDIAEMMEYLYETDEIEVIIDGETHPIREIISEGGEKIREGIPNEEDYDWAEINQKTGETIYHFSEEYEETEIDYYDYEEQTFKKENGKVVIKNEHPDEDRWTSSNLGIQEMLVYNIAYPESDKNSEIQGNTDTVDTYIKYIAKQFAGNENFIPIVQDFIYKTFDSKKLEELTEEEYNRFSKCITPDENKLAQITEIREKFKTIESTKSYLEQIKMEFSEEKENQTVERKIPNFIDNMSKKDINDLGGLEQILKLVEVKGEEETKELLSILGYETGATLEELQKIKEEQEAREIRLKSILEKYKENIRNSDYLIDSIENDLKEFEEELMK